MIEILRLYLEQRATMSDHERGVLLDEIRKLSALMFTTPPLRQFFRHCRTCTTRFHALDPVEPSECPRCANLRAATGP
jgi:predicted Zn-ribbon and HTH transcriptional regulator